MLEALKIVLLIKWVHGDPIYSELAIAKAVNYSKPCDIIHVLVAKEPTGRFLGK